MQKLIEFPFCFVRLIQNIYILKKKNAKAQLGQMQAADSRHRQAVNAHNNLMCRACEFESSF